MDSSAHECSHYHIHEMVPVRDQDGHRQAPGSALGQLEVKFESKAGNRALSLSPRQNCQLGVLPPCTPSIHCKDTRHTEVYFKKIIYKRPLVFGRLPALGAGGNALSTKRLGEAGEGSQGKPGEMGFRGPDLYWCWEAARFGTALQLGPAKPLELGRSTKAQEAK